MNEFGVKEMGTTFNATVQGWTHSAANDDVLKPFHPCPKEWCSKRRCPATCWHLTAEPKIGRPHQLQASIPIIFSVVSLQTSAPTERMYIIFRRAHSDPFYDLTKDMGKAVGILCHDTSSPSWCI